MEEILGMILLVITIIVSLPIIGFMVLCGILWFCRLETGKKI